MAQQTAVDLLLTKIPNAAEIKEFISNNDADEKMLDEWLFERIYKGVDYKQMEKQQHEKFNKFLDVEKVLGISDLKTIERIQWYYNNYFNETYKKD
jgi:hypothetical protein